jgi:hypothetical protein
MRTVGAGARARAVSRGWAASAGRLIRLLCFVGVGIAALNPAVAMDDDGVSINIRRSSGAGSFQPPAVGAGASTRVPTRLVRGMRRCDAAP